MKRWLPLFAFGLILLLAGIGLFRPSDRVIRSRLVGRPMPALMLPAIVPGHPGLSATPGVPRLVNLFASWCVPCASEVAELQRLRGRGVIVDGLAVRDRTADLQVFLDRHGDPYRAIGDDPQSRSMIALGASGVPESFIVDGAGVVRYHHVGAIGSQDFEAVLAAWQALR